MKVEYVEMFTKAASLWGAFGMAEAVAMHEAIEQHALQGAAYNAVEFGSHRGKSGCVLAHALQMARFGGKLFLVDPLYALDPEADIFTADWSRTNLGSVEQMQNTYQHMESPTNVYSEVLSGVTSCLEIPFVHLVGDLSVDFLRKEQDRPFNVVHIDSDPHEYGMIKEEVLLLEPFIVPGTLVFFHDYNNVFADPARVVKEMLASGSYEEVHLPWERAEEFVHEHELEKISHTFHSPGRYLACIKKV
jgi:Methyltransferase domain